jgi:hypothetical protein
MLTIYTDLIAVTPPEEIMYGYGPLGVIVVALSVVGYKMFNIILKDRDKAIKDRDALLEEIFTKVLPAIANSTEAQLSRQGLDREYLETIKDFNRRLDEITFVLKHGHPTKSGGS